MVQHFGRVMDSIYMRFYIIVLTFLFIHLGSYAQIPETNPTYNFGNHWIFGRNVHLEFTDTGVIQHTISGINWLEGTSSISDTLGNLDLYIASQELKDNQSNFVGQVLGSNSSTQAYLLIKPLESKKYHLLSSSLSGNCRYRYVDENFNMFETKHLPFRSGEKQQAVNHRNGRDIWYANHANTGDSIFFFLIKKEGMVCCPVVGHTGHHYLRNTATQGQMKFSPDGSASCRGRLCEHQIHLGLVFFQQSSHPQLERIYVMSENSNLFPLNGRITTIWN
jgi:hypothetical protein